MVTTEELDHDPERILRLAEQIRVTICNGGVPVACLVPVDEWRDLAETSDNPAVTRPTGKRGNLS